MTNPSACAVGARSPIHPLKLALRHGVELLVGALEGRRGLLGVVGVDAGVIDRVEVDLFRIVLRLRRTDVASGISEVAGTLAEPPGRPSIFPPRRPQRAPVRAVAIARRRHLAASGPMPPALAARFTVGELAVLRIVGDEVRVDGLCGLCIDAIAARAGVCRRLARNAIRQAARLGLLTIQERRREGQKTLPNIVRVISREWLQWLRLGARPIAKSPASGGSRRDKQIGGKNIPPTANRLEKED